MKKKDLINEVMGVPKSIDRWVDIFSYIVTGMAKGITNQEEIEESEIDYVDPESKKEVHSTAYRGKASMDGKEVMNWTLKLGGYSDLKDLLNDPNFKSFPMYQPSIGVTLIFFPDSLWKAELGGKEIADASHGWAPSTIKLAKLGGSNIVFTGQEFTFKCYLPHSWLDNLDTDKFRTLLKPVIAHEMTHAYEIYMRYKKTEDPFMGRETFLNAAAKMMKDQKYPQWNDFLHILYLHLSFEINARITQLYYEMEKKGVTTQEEFMKALKESGVWKEIKMLEDFDADEFISSFKYKDVGLFGMLEDLGRQIGRTARGMVPIKMERDPKAGMKHLIDGWDLTLQALNQELTKSGMYKGKFMDVVPPKAKEDPRVFFKFFEKRFHKKAEGFKRKALRVASLVLDEKNEEKT